MEFRSGSQLPAQVVAGDLCEREGERYTIYTADSDALVRRLVGDGVRFTDLTVRGASLEEAFLRLTEPTESRAA